MNSRGSTYIIERLSIYNIADLFQLHEAVYCRKQPVGYFEKKYNTGYTGTQYVGYFVYNESREPIAFYGVIPTLLWYNNQTILAAQSADTMTHPHHRNKGLFTELANHTYALCRTEGIRLLFGFPNQNSLPGLINKLDWYVTGTMDRFLVPVKKSLPLEKIANKYPALKMAYSRYRQWVLKRYLKTGYGVANSVLTNDCNGVYRDVNYLEYKTYSPTGIIDIDGTLFWIKLQNGLQIGDIENIPEDFKGTIDKLRKLGAKLGITAIHFQTSPGTPLHRLFVQYYKPELSFPVIFKDLSEGLSTEKIKFTLADIDIF
jgi:GNAT superfamily N-acetyltransferase